MRSNAVRLLLLRPPPNALYIFHRFWRYSEESRPKNRLPRILSPDSTEQCFSVVRGSSGINVRIAISLLSCYAQKVRLLIVPARTARASP